MKDSAPCAPPVVLSQGSTFTAALFKNNQRVWQPIKVKDYETGFVTYFDVLFSEPVSGHVTVWLVHMPGDSMPAFRHPLSPQPTLSSQGLGPQRID